MTDNLRLRIGSRGSPLALWQTDYIIRQLERLHPGIVIEKIIMKTTGDIILDSPLSKIGDKGLFTKELERALLDDQIDLAVHSMKDMPTILPDGLIIGAVPAREDVRDVFIRHPQKSYTALSDVPRGGHIATGSLRRKSQLLHARPDITAEELRGNLGTRLKKLEESDWDGMILAMAGVKRLGLEEQITEALPLDWMLPAVGQGALAIEIRDRDERVARLINPLTDEPTRRAVEAERALLRTLEGGCQIPVGAYATVHAGEMQLDAMVGSIDGKEVIRESLNGLAEEAQSIGEALAQILIGLGANRILQNIRGNNT